MYLKLPESIHFELTDLCNAMCPMCDRVDIIDGELVESKLVTKSQLSFDKYYDVFGDRQIKNVNYCGNLGDPLMAKDLMQFVLHFERLGANQRIHTNGSVRNKEFWEDLAKIKNFYVVFGIDGIVQEQHEKYRVGTDLNKIFENAKTFIENGGIAIWQMLVFDFNEENVNDAKKLSKEMGFKQFTTRNTESRFNLVYSTNSITYRYNENINYLRPPSKKYNASITSKASLLSEMTIDKYKKIKNVSCDAKKAHEIFIDSKGNIYPCCYIANSPVFKPDNIKNHKVDDLIYSTKFEELDYSIKNNPNEICKVVCGDQN